MPLGATRRCPLNTDWQLTLCSHGEWRRVILCKSNCDREYFSKTALVREISNRDWEKYFFKTALVRLLPSKHVILCRLHEDLIQSLDPWGVPYNTIPRNRTAAFKKGWFTEKKWWLTQSNGSKQIQYEIWQGAAIIWTEDACAPQKQECPADWIGLS